MFLDGAISEDGLKTALAENKAKKDGLQQEIITLEQDLAEDDSEYLRLMINKIVGRGLSFEQYHELIPLTIKQILVYQDHITVQTYFGDINLPRFKNRGILVLPEYKWKNTGKEFKIYYHTNTFNIYKPHKQIFKYQQLTIYQQEEN